MRKSPFLRLLSVTTLVLFFGLLALMLLRWLGSQQMYAPTPHPWMQKSHWLIARMPPTDCSQMAMEQLLELDDSWLIWVDLQPNSQQEFEVVCPESHIFEVRGPARRGPSLARILPLLKKRGVIFNLRAVDISVTKPFLKIMDEWAEKKSDVGIASTSQALLRDLRKSHADWLFAADASAWTKLRFFMSLGVESAIELWPDFFVASLDHNDPNYFNLGAAEEIARRKKMTILELNDAEVDPQWHSHLNGILTTRPKNFSADTFFKKSGAE